MRYVDFSQFKPRGHYAGDSTLEAYFRAMIWLGRTDLRFLQYDTFAPAGLAAALLPPAVPGRAAAGRADGRQRPRSHLAADRRRAARVRGRVRQHDRRRLPEAARHRGRRDARRAGGPVRRRHRAGAARRRLRDPAHRQPDPVRPARRRGRAARSGVPVLRPALRHRQRRCSRTSSSIASWASRSG